jgi:hypothetical protein
MLLSICAFWCSSRPRERKGRKKNWHVMQESDCWLNVGGVIANELLQ